jgi:drug/metabolite transporter (DMT)-like permease
MNIVLILIVILSAYIHAIWNFLAKRSENKLVFIWLAKIFQTLIYLPVIIFLIKENTIPIYGWYAILGSGVIHIFYWLFLSRAYSNEDLSVVYPISRSAPAFVLIFAVIFLNEKVKWPGIIGILIILLGLYIISFESLNFKTFLNSLRNFKRKGFIYALLTLLTVTLYSLVDKIGSQYVNAILYVYIFDLIAFAGLTPIIMVREGRSKISTEWRHNRLSIILTGIMVVMSYSLAIFVMRSSPVSYVVSIREIGIVFGVLLGSLVLKEKYGKIRLIASLVILSGILLIAFAG